MKGRIAQGWVSLVIACTCAVSGWVAHASPNNSTGLTAPQAWDAVTTTLERAAGYKKISHRALFYRDTADLTAAQAYETIRAANPAQLSFSAIGNNRSVFWMLMRVDNRSGQRDWVMTCTNHLFKDVDLFVPDGAQGWSRVEFAPVGAGYFGMDLQRHALLTLPPGATDLLVRFDVDVMHPPYLRLQQPALARTNSNLFTIITLLCLGATASLILYNAFIALQLRSLVYGLYCVYGVTHLLFMMVVSGVMTWVLGHGDGDVHSSTHQYSSATIGAMLLFTLAFMHSGRKARLPRWGTVALSIAAVACLSFLTVSLLRPDLTLSTRGIYILIYLGSLFLILGIAITQRVRGFPGSSVFLLAWSILVAAYLYAAFNGLSLEGRGIWGNLVPLVGGTIEMVLLSLALGQRFFALRQQAEAERARSQQLRVESARKSEFVQTLTHDIRAPLHSVMSALELVRSTDDKKTRLAHLDTARYGTETLYDLVDSMLDAVNIDVTPREQIDQEFDLQCLVRATTGIFAARASAKNLQLTADDIPPLQLHGPAIVIRRSLINLISNAVKYTHSGSVRVAARLDDLEVVGQADALTLEITVTDTGPGVDDAQLATTAPGSPNTDVYSAAPSSNVGLVISRQIVAKAGGTLTLRKRSADNAGLDEHGGTQAILRVPVGRSRLGVDGDPLDVAERNNAAGQALLIDDDATTCQVLAAALERAGYAVTARGDLRSGKASLAEAHWRLVVCDHRLPDGDGFALMRGYRLAGHNGALILVSAALSRSADDVLRLGIVPLQKPVSDAALAAASRRAEAVANDLRLLTGPDALTASLPPVQHASICEVFVAQATTDIAIVRARGAEPKARHVAAHRLASAATTLGLTATREAALVVEAQLLPLLDGGSVATSGRERFTASIAALAEAVDASVTACQVVVSRGAESDSA